MPTLGTAGRALALTIVAALIALSIAVPRVHAQFLSSWTRVGVYDVVKVVGNGSCWYRVYAYRRINLTVCAPWWTGERRCVSLRGFVGSMVVAPPATVYVSYNSTTNIHYLQPCYPRTGFSIAPQRFASPFPYSIAIYFGSQPAEGVRVWGAVSGYVPRPVSGSGWAPIYVEGFSGGSFVAVSTVVFGPRPMSNVTWIGAYMVRNPAKYISFRGNEVCSSLPESVRVVAYLANGTVVARDVYESCARAPPNATRVVVFVDDEVVSPSGGLVVSLLTKRVAGGRWGLVVAPASVYVVPGERFELYTPYAAISVNGSTLYPGTCVEVDGCSLCMPRKGSVQGVCTVVGTHVLEVSADGVRQRLVIYVSRPASFALAIPAMAGAGALLGWLAVRGVSIVARGEGREELPRYLTELVTSVCGAVAAAIGLSLFGTWQTLFTMVAGTGAIPRIESVIAELERALRAMAIEYVALGSVAGAISTFIGAVWSFIASPVIQLVASVVRAFAASIYAASSVVMPLLATTLNYVATAAALLILIEVLILLGATCIPPLLVAAGIALMVAPPARSVGRVLVATGLSMVIASVAASRLIGLVITSPPPPPPSPATVLGALVGQNVVFSALPSILWFAASAVAVVMVYAVAYSISFMLVMWVGRTIFRPPSRS